MATEPLLQVRHLKQYFGKRKNIVKAVDDVSFNVYPGEVLGLVGESGSGKSTTGRSIIGLYNITSGDIQYKDKLISAGEMTRKEIAKEMQMIFQDPYASLDPRMKVNEIIGEAYDIHGMYSKASQRRDKITELLESVGLNAEHANRYAHEFSGGQRQRIGIARALALEPSFIIADEPISALDVSIQAQVVNLLKNLQKKRNLAYLFIAHDLSMVKYISDRIAVMYRGKIVELGEASKIYHHSIHPYTRSLLSAIPQPDPISEKDRQRIVYVHEPGQGDLSYHELDPGHYVYGSADQVKAWKAQVS